MGQKTSPKAIRLGITHTWPERWYARKKKYHELLTRDVDLRDKIMDLMPDAGISKIEIERGNKRLLVTINTSKPGIIIGKQGDKIEELKTTLAKELGERIDINIKEIKKPDLDAKILGDLVADQIERRIAYRRAAKLALEKAMDAGAIGAKVLVSGRLNGVEISRREYFKKGNIPLHTFRANIDFAKSRAETTYGSIGIKTWIYKGNVFKTDKIE